MKSTSWSAKDLVNKWGRKLPLHIATALPWDVLGKLVEGLSADTALPLERLKQAISARDVGGLVAIASNLDPTKYGSADLLLQDRIVVDLFAKFDFVNSPFNKREKAQLRFAEAETMCAETNERLQKSPLGLDNDVNAVLHSAIRTISATLGRFDVNEMLTFSRFGPGGTLCVTGPFTTQYFKLCERCPTVSPEAFPYAEALLDFDHVWRGYLLGIHPFDVKGPFNPIDGLGAELALAPYNKVTFVPKNAKTERSIAIEPYFNLFFQLGIGGMMRKRLFERANINLDSQLRNQMLAQKGSITGDLATVDFSMASDTISIETVRLLLPPAWFQHLDQLRSANFKMNNVVRRYSKFSSMGNGYTFELETLIFWAIAVSTCAELGLPVEDISVFGDDVIIPSAACELYYKTCKYLGFKVNDEKSFTKGDFRESCGEDFLKGFRVRPVFCKELGTVQQCVSLANRLAALNRAVGIGSRCNTPLLAAVSLLLSRVPRDVRKLVIGPPSEDYDGYIHTDCPSEIAGSSLVKWNRHLYAWEHPSIRFRPKQLKRRDDAAALWIQWGTAVRRSPIPKVETVCKLLSSKIFGFSDISDFYQESVPRQITGRKIGSLALGTNLVWTLGKFC